MQRPEIFTRDVGLEKNDRLGTMHTSDHRRSEEEEEEETRKKKKKKKKKKEYDDGFRI